jgi:hypothetical protein
MRTNIPFFLSSKPLFSFLVLAAVGQGCAAVADDDVAAEQDISSSALAVRGSIAVNECVATAGVETRMYIAFEFDAKAGKRYALELDGFSSPDLRVFTRAGKQVLRGKQWFWGDGENGGFVSDATFVPTKDGRYLLALRDANGLVSERTRVSLKVEDLDTNVPMGRCKQR